jgi:alkylation response protein AidB-like acyl-CoA dehydrogenase
MRYQSYACGKNHWLSDPDLRSILNHFWDDLSKHESALKAFGEVAGGPLYELGDHVDQHAVPELVMFDLDGKRVDRARLSPMHSLLLKEHASINRPPYEGGSWHHHFAYIYLIADPGLSCTFTVTNQTVYVIHKYAPEHSQWVDRMLSGEAWGATWMTETQGGSDLGANTTFARQEGDKWILFGAEKSFASNAGLTDIAVVTARPEGAPSGAKGLATFLVPRLNEAGELNYRIRRYKRKLATRGVPTGEVELDASEAYLVGEAEKGIYYTLETLTVARLANAIGAMGLARKAHLEAAYRVQARSAFGKPIVEHPLVRRDLTDLAVRTAGGTVLIFHTIDAFDRAWHAEPPYTSQYHYARFLSHLAKNRTAEHAADGTLLAMELFGGLGFMDEVAVARLHREALVTPIWEGGSNIQALDMLEAMAKKGAHEPFLDEFIPMLEKAGTPEAIESRSAIERELSKLGSLGALEAQWYSKDSLRTLADAAQVALLYALAEEAGERYAKLAALYAHRFVMGEPYPDWALSDREIWLPTSLEA